MTHDGAAAKPGADEPATPRTSPLARTRRLSRGLVAGAVLTSVAATGALAAPALAGDQGADARGTSVGTGQRSTLLGTGSTTSGSHATSSGS